MGVATTLAIVGAATAAASSVASFSQANKQQKAQREAEQAANKAMFEAKSLLDKNYYAALGIQKEPYELEREAMLAQGAQAIQAGQESERGAAATAGRVQMAQNEGQAGVRTAMGKELGDLAKLTAQEDSRLRDVGVQLNLEESAGAQQAAADAERAAAAATAQGWQSATSAIQQGVSAIPLYMAGSQKSQAKANMAAMGGAPEVVQGFTGALPGAKAPMSYNGNPQQQQMVQDQMEKVMQGSMKYRGGTKFGTPIQTPSSIDAFNYLNYYK